MRHPSSIDKTKRHRTPKREYGGGSDFLGAILDRSCLLSVLLLMSSLHSRFIHEHTTKFGRTTFTQRSFWRWWHVGQYNSRALLRRLAVQYNEKAIM